LNEVDDTSIFKTARPIRYRRSLLQWPRSRPGYPRSGLSHSDFVPWPKAESDRYGRLVRNRRVGWPVVDLARSTRLPASLRRWRSCVSRWSAPTGAAEPTA